MKILVVCEQGNNRSVTIAHHLKYWGHDVLAAGILTNEAETLTMLGDWADRIILTAQVQADVFPDFHPHKPKTQLWDVGPDTYHRPFNPVLLRKVRGLMEQHKQEYKP